MRISSRFISTILLLLIWLIFCLMEIIKLCNHLGENVKFAISLNTFGTISIKQKDIGRFNPKEADTWKAS